MKGCDKRIAAAWRELQSCWDLEERAALRRSIDAWLDTRHALTSRGDSFPADA